ncbi:MAG: hypothetical protein C0504_03415 [Candidatus Solibacter sp.]|nr:hypothetical protein [Candidatus Solibacter sp.]
MKLRHAIAAVVLIALAATAVLAFQRGGGRRGFRVFQDSDEPLVLPSDANEKNEFNFARLRYTNVRASGMWAARGSWSVDYPKADRQFLMGVRRLTRLNTHSIETVVDLHSDEIFNHPFVYVVEPGHWNLSGTEAAKLREYVERGGFLMTDDFHGTYSWGNFMASLSRAFPDKSVTDIPNDDPIFHVVYGLQDRFQVPGIVNYPFQQTHEYDGFESRWRAVRDSKGRIVVAICHNMDLGDAWEWADHPEYPEKYASLAYRIGINYILYAMTH